MSMNAASLSYSSKPTNGGAEAEGVIRVAVVDDDDLFREALGLNLTDEGYDVVSFAKGGEALDYFKSGGAADIVLLDWRMPELDGIEVLRRMRTAGLDVPVIFLTVLSDEIYEEAALAGGAVDFVEKSRSLPILLRRLKLSVGGRKGAEPTEAADHIRRQGPLLLDMDASKATWRSQPVDLTLTEFRIVTLMAGRAGDNLTYREIYDLVRGEGFVAGYGTVGYRSNVRAFIKRIRQKFRSVDPDFEQIENYPGLGYRWSTDHA